MSATAQRRINAAEFLAWAQTQDDDTVYEPDGLINCGDPVRADSLLAPAPVVIVEVISPSSRSFDKNSKLSDYFRLASVKHYLIVDRSRRLILHYRRQADQIVVAIVKEGRMTLDPPGIDVAVDQLLPEIAA